MGLMARSGVTIGGVCTGLVILLVTRAFLQLIPGPTDSYADAIALPVAVLVWAVAARWLSMQWPSAVGAFHVAAFFILIVVGVIISWIPVDTNIPFTDSDLRKMVEPLPAVFGTLMITYAVDGLRSSRRSPTGRLLIALTGFSATVVGLVTTVLTPWLLSDPTDDVVLKGKGINPQVVGHGEGLTQDGATLLRTIAASLTIAVLGLGLLLILAYVDPQDALGDGKRRD